MPLAGPADVVGIRACAAALLARNDDAEDPLRAHDPERRLDVAARDRPVGAESHHDQVRQRARVLACAQQADALAPLTAPARVGLHLLLLGQIRHGEDHRGVADHERRPVRVVPRTGVRRDHSAAVSGRGGRHGREHDGASDMDVPDPHRCGTLPSRALLFPTVQFAIFFPVVLALNWALMPRPKFWKPFIVVASYAFYAAENWKFCFLLGGITLWNQGAARLIHASDDERRRRWIVGLAVAGNLGV